VKAGVNEEFEPKTKLLKSIRGTLLYFLKRGLAKKKKKKKKKKNRFSGSPSDIC
jgi:hypothetical protein